MANDVMTSSYGAVALSDNFQGPNISRLSREISSARAADVSPGTGGLTPGQGMLILFSDMRDSLLAIAENTLKTNDLLETAITGTPEQQRDAGISAEDRDPAPGREEDDEGGPGFLSRLAGGTREFFGTTLGKGLVAGLALLGTYVFEDEIVEGVGRFFRYMKEDFIPDIKALYDDLSLWWKDTWKKVTTFFTYVKGIFTQIGDYVDSFDINDEEGLQEDEIKALKEDLAEKVGTFVKDSILGAFGTFFSGLGLAAGVATAASIVGLGPLKLALGLGTKPTGVPGSVGAAKLGVAGSLAIGLIVANSVFKTYQKVMQGIEDATTEEGEVDYSKFVGSFFGGDAEGSWGNAFRNAGQGGQMFAGPGALIGLSLAGPPGALLGGALGYLIGATIFGIGGLLGADKIDAFVTNVTDDLKAARDKIGDFFSSLIGGVKSLFRGDSFAEGYLGSKLDKAEAELQIFEDQYVQLLKAGSIDEASEFMKETLQPQRDKVKKLRENVKLAGERADEPEAIQEARKSLLHYDQENSMLETLNRQDQAIIDNDNIHSGSQVKIDAIKAVGERDLMIEENENKIKELEAIIAEFEGREPVVKTPTNMANPITTNPETLSAIRALRSDAAYSMAPPVIMDNSDKSVNQKVDNNIMSDQSAVPSQGQGWFSGGAEFWGIQSNN